MHVVLTTCAGNGLRTVTSDRNRVGRIPRFLFLFELVGMTSLDRSYWEVVNLLFALPILPNTEKILQFSNERFSTCVARGQELSNSSRNFHVDFFIYLKFRQHNRNTEINEVLQKFTLWKTRSSLRDRKYFASYCTNGQVY